MQEKTLYYFFSLSIVLLITLYISNAIWYRLKGRTLLGERYKVGTIEYRRLNKASNNKVLAIASFILLCFLINLVYAVRMVRGQITYLLFGAVATITTFILLCIVAHNTLNGDK